MHFIFKHHVGLSWQPYRAFQLKSAGYHDTISHVTEAHFNKEKTKIGSAPVFHLLPYILIQPLSPAFLFLLTLGDETYNPNCWVHSGIQDSQGICM